MNWLTNFRLISLLLVVAGFFFLAPPKINTDIMALMPDANLQADDVRLLSQSSQALQNQVMVLLVGAQQDALYLEAKKLTSTITAKSLFSGIHWKVEPGLAQQNYQKLLPFRASLITDEQYKQTTPLNWLMSQWLAPNASIDGLSSDPLLLGRGLKERFSVEGFSGLYKDVPILNRGDLLAIGIRLETRESANSLEYQARLSSWLSDVKEAQKDSGIKMYAVGAALYAHAGTEQAKDEASVIGSMSISLIILLLLITLRPLRLYLWVLSPIVIGTLFALLTTSLLFDGVHILTLVFGITLLGVSIDYVFHWLLCNEAGNNRQLKFKLIASAATSSAAFVVQSFSPFPAIAEMGFFAAVGLITAMAVVLLIFPVVANKAVINVSAWSWLNNIAVAGYKTKTGLLSLTILMISASFYFMNADDDIRKLQAVDSQLKAQEDYIRQWYNFGTGHSTFIVQGETQQELLNNLWQLEGSLKQQKFIGNISHWQSISNWVLPEAEQVNRIRVVNSWAESGALLDQLSDQLGLKPQITRQYRSELEQNEILSIDDFLAFPIAQPFESLWLKDRDNRWLAAVPVQPVNSTHAQNTLYKIAEDENIQYINQASLISESLSQAREVSIRWLIVAYLFIFGFMWLAYGSEAIWRISVPLGGTALALTGNLLMGNPLNMFTVLALLMTLGMGIDFAIFSKEKDLKSRIAITMSAITTILAFGLLGFSQVPVLANIGFTLSLGILGCWIFSMYLSNLTTGNKNA